MAMKEFNSMRKVLLAPAGADNPEAYPESPCILTALVLEAALRELAFLDVYILSAALGDYGGRVHIAPFAAGQDSRL